MNTEELAIVSEVRDGMERMLAESRERNQSLQELKRIVSQIENELQELEWRIFQLETR